MKPGNDTMDDEPDMQGAIPGVPDDVKLVDNKGKLLEE